MTLVELLIAMGIGTILLLFVTSITSRVAQVRTYATTRLFDELDSSLGVRVLVGQLNRSQVLRTGLFRCSGVGASFALGLPDGLSKTQNHIVGQGGVDAFEFPYWEATAIASPDPQNIAMVNVTDAERFPKNSLVTMTNSRDSRIGGVFSVVDVDIAGGKLTLGPPNLQGTRFCAVDTGNSQSLSQLVTSSGSRAKVFVLQRVRIAAYSVAADPVHGAVLSLQTYPFSGQGEAPKISVVTGFTKMDLTFAWTNYVRESAAGRMQIDVLTAFKRQTGQTTVNESGQSVRATDDQTIGSQGSYEITPVQRENPAAETAALPSLSEFPTCSVFLEPADGAKLPPGFEPAANGKLYYLTGSFAGLARNPLSIDVSPSPNPGAEVICTNADGSVSSNGSTSLRIPGGVVERQICSIRGGLILGGGMKYFDNTLGKALTANCTGMSVNVPTGWKYDGAASRCTRDGDISIGDLVDGTGKIPGPALYLSDKSCLWSNSSEFTECTPPETADAVLEQVQLYPQNLTVDGQGGGNRVTCQ